jgi:hypothetical protein
MEHYKEQLIAVAKTAPAWLGVFVGHAIDSITLSGLALFASTVYSVVQTYISISRYRGQK